MDLVPLSEAVLDAFIAGLDSPAHSPESRRSWCRLFLRDAALEVKELRAGFELRWAADMRAIKRWQEAHPGKELTWPDHADLVVWLLGEVERLMPVPPTTAPMMTERGVEVEYRLKPDGSLDGCARCQDGAHWECHGCSCPCSYPPMEAQLRDGPEFQAWNAAVNKIGKRITVEEREQQWKDRGV